MERLVDTQPYLEPSLWKYFAFDAMAFVDHFFSIPRNFHGDYQMLRALSTTQLSTLLEDQLVMWFLVEIVLREKCVENLGRMQSRVSNLNKRTCEGEMALR